MSKVTRPMKTNDAKIRQNQNVIWNRPRLKGRSLRLNCGIDESRIMVVYRHISTVHKMTRAESKIPNVIRPLW